MGEFTVALIDESRCIGCAKCLPACPVDAIVGAERYLHTVIERECIGCGLCLPPCPVDCITMEPVVQKPFDDVIARQRVKARKARLAREAQQTRETRAQLQSQADGGAYDPLAAALARLKSP